MNTFVSFDGSKIAYHDEGKGHPVILLHGYGVDGLDQFGHFDRILPLLKKRRELFLETFGGDVPQLRIPTKAITNSDLSRSAIRRHADHARSEATLADEILTEVIGIRQRMR